MSDIENEQRLVNIHFEVTTRATEADRDVIGHDLHGDHRQRLGLSGIHFAWHDR